MRCGGGQCGDSGASQKGASIYLGSLTDHVGSSRGRKLSLLKAGRARFVADKSPPALG